jgi:SP family sugar porter-like MFS transporter
MILSPETPSPRSPTNLNLAFIWFISLVAAMGGLLFGYDWVVIGGAKPFYEKFFALSDPARQGWAMSCALVGCLAGALASGALSDRFGRKRPLILSAFTFAVSSLGTALAHGLPAFVAWRIAGGMAIGMASNLSPMYIAEISPPNVRGKLVSINQLTIVIGILLAQVDNWLIADKVPPDFTARQILNSWNGQTGWRWMFGVTAIPAALFFIGMFAAAGYKISDILFAIVVTGAVNLIFTFIAIAAVDRAGRRKLMLTGAAGLAVIYTLLGAGYRAHSHGPHMLILVVAAIGCYAMSLAPVTWVVISEIFPNRNRGAAMSVATASLWIACFVLTYTFPLLNQRVGPAGTFWLYAAICVGGFFFIERRLPETKGKTLEEIEKELTR